MQQGRNAVIRPGIQNLEILRLLRLSRQMCLSPLIHDGTLIDIEPRERKLTSVAM